MNVWIFILAIILVIGLYSWHKSNQQDKILRQKSKKRGVVSKQLFIETLEKRQFEKMWIEKLYDIIVDYVPKSDFTMAVDDKLVDDYRIDDEDLVDIANELFLERNGFKAKEVDFRKAETRGASIHTFEGILLFITREKYNKGRGIGCSDMSI